MPVETLAQLFKLTVTSDRVPRGQAPVYEYVLSEGERVVGVAHEYSHDRKDRKTVDWTISLWVEFSSEGSGE